MPLSEKILGEFESRWMAEGRHPLFQEVIRLARQDASNEELAVAYEEAANAEIETLKAS